jgi:WD40 repeat protein
MGIWRRREEVTTAGGDGIVIEGDDDEVPVEFNASGTAKRGAGDDASDDSNEEDWEFAIVLEGHDSEIKTVSYSPSGQFLASCSRDKSIWIWEEIGEEGEDEFETIAVLQEHTADVKCVSWRRDDGNGEVLASASYDDTIRLWRGDDDGEWNCVGVLEGHDGTVWSLEWEPEISMKLLAESSGSQDTEEQEKDYSPKIPRLLSSSADHTIRIWSQAPAPPPPNRPSYFNSGIPSTMRPAPTTETWEVTSTLPKAHTLPIYSTSWSSKSGRVVSSGGDGKIVIYEEVIRGRTRVGGPIEREWVVAGVLEGAHGPYEVNHVTWCGRYDGGRKGEEEMVVSTGDDGVVRAWVVEDILNKS